MADLKKLDDQLPEVKPVPKEKPKKGIWDKIKDVVSGTKKEIKKDSKTVYDDVK